MAAHPIGASLCLSLGMALAGRIQKRAYRVMAVLGDGECNEGSVWEAAMVAAAQCLDRVMVIVDANGWQATDRSASITGGASLAAKFRAFGWDARDIDGHDSRALVALMSAPPSGRPVALIAHTVKGKGVSFMEDDNNWHYRSPPAQEVAAAQAELGVL